MTIKTPKTYYCMSAKQKYSSLMNIVSLFLGKKNHPISWVASITQKTLINYLLTNSNNYKNLSIIFSQ